MKARIDKLPSVVMDFNNGPSSTLAFSNKAMNASFSAITGDVVSAVCNVRVYKTCPVS